MIIPLIITTILFLLSIIVSWYFIIPTILFASFYGIKHYKALTSYIELEDNIYLDSNYEYLKNEVLLQLQRLKGNCIEFGFSELYLKPIYITFNKGIIEFGNRKLSGRTDSSNEKVYITVALYEPGTFRYDKNMNLYKSALVHELAHVILFRRLGFWSDEVHHQIISEKKLDR
jgi:hypothetical protein